MTTPPFFRISDRQDRVRTTLRLQIAQSTQMEEFEQDADWQHWFRKHGPKLLLCARQWTSRPSDAEDIVQEAFVRFWKHQRHLLSRDADPGPLLLVSIRRAAFDLARRVASRSRREDAASTDPSEPGSPWFETPDSDDRTQSVATALQELPSEQREVVVLKIWGELTFDAIAHQLGIPLNTAASRYRYGLLGLRKHLLSAKPATP